MDTDQILDLFTVSTQTDTDSKKKRAEDGKKTTAKAVLENLEALWDEKEYEEEYNLDGFIDSLKR